MKEDLPPYNDFFKKKLENHESSTPDDLFDNIMRKRGGSSSEPSDAPYNDFFKKKLGNHESLVSEDLFDRLIRNREGSDVLPSDAPLRERILEHTEAVSKPTFEAVIEERERRRRALVWRFAAAMLLFFTAYLVFLNKNSSLNGVDGKTSRPVNLDNNKTQAENEESKDTNISTTVAQSPVSSNQPAISNNQSKNTEGVIFSQSHKSLTVNNQSKNISVSKTALANALTESNRSKVSTTNSHNILFKVIDSLKMVSNSTNFITEHTAEQQIIIPTVPIVFYSSTAEVAKFNHFLDESKGLEVTSPSASNSTLSVQSNQDLTLNNQTPLFDNLSIFKLKNIALPAPQLKNPCKTGPGDGCPSFGKQRKRGGGEKSIYVDVYGAPEYAFRRLTENLPEMTSYRQARDTVESPWYAFSVGARASLVFESGLALRTGFVYNQTNEVAVFDSLGVGKKTLEFEETYTPRLGGGFDTTRVLKSTTYQLGVFRTTMHNRYRSIDIPLQLGFEVPMNDYWSFSLNGGVNFNISSWRKANILGEKRMRQDVSSDFGQPNTIFSNSLGFSIFGSIAAYRHIGGHLQLVIEPSVRHYLQPITRSDYALKQAYTNAGLIFGLRYRL
jgi:hypothetical protein